MPEITYLLYRKKKRKEERGRRRKGHTFAVLVVLIFEIDRILSHVPDIAGGILGVPIEGLFNQFVVRDTNANPLGVVFSNAGTGRIGRP